MMLLSPLYPLTPMQGYMILLNSFTVLANKGDVTAHGGVEFTAYSTHQMGKAATDHLQPYRNSQHFKKLICFLIPKNQFTQKYISLNISCFLKAEDTITSVDVLLHTLFVTQFINVNLEYKSDADTLEYPQR